MLWSYAKFIKRIVHHKYWVLYYGIKIGGVPLWNLLTHDMSKFSREEFKPRFRHQILKVIPYESEEYQKCMDAHHERNAHHWQYWLWKKGVPHKNGEPMPMPEREVRHMLADWQAAQKTYKGEKLSDWFRIEYPKMCLHPETVGILEPLLKAIGIEIPK